MSDPAFNYSIAPAQPEWPLIEGGRRVHVTFSGDLAVKTALERSTMADAAEMASGLLAYAAQLEVEPIAVAKLRNVRLASGGALYQVQHKMDIVQGPSLVRLEPADRQRAVSDIVAGICAMSEHNGPDSLAVPIDGAAKNWHMDGSTPTLVDLYPPLLRDKNGQMPLIETPATRGYWEYRYGTKSGAITGIMYSSLNLNAATQTARPVARVKHLLKQADEWCYDALPASMDPTVRRCVERQIRFRFLPLITRSGVRITRNRLSGLK